MICECLRRDVRVIEVPVSYHAREGGESAHSGGMLPVIKTAMKMFSCIFRKRLSRRPAPTTPPQTAD